MSQKFGLFRLQKFGLFQPQKFGLFSAYLGQPKLFDCLSNSLFLFNFAVKIRPLFSQKTVSLDSPSTPDPWDQVDVVGDVVRDVGREGRKNTDFLTQKQSLIQEFTLAAILACC